MTKHWSCLHVCQWIHNCAVGWKAALQSIRKEQEMVAVFSYLLLVQTSKTQANALLQVAGRRPTSTLPLLQLPGLLFKCFVENSNGGVTARPSCWRRSSVAPTIQKGFWVQKRSGRLAECPTSGHEWMGYQRINHRTKWNEQKQSRPITPRRKTQGKIRNLLSYWYWRLGFPKCKQPEGLLTKDRKNHQSITPYKLVDDARKEDQRL